MTDTQGDALHPAQHQGAHVFSAPLTPACPFAAVLFEGRTEGGASEPRAPSSHSPISMGHTAYNGICTEGKEEERNATGPRAAATLVMDGKIKRGKGGSGLKGGAATSRAGQSGPSSLWPGPSPGPGEFLMEKIKNSFFFFSGPFQKTEL